MISNSVRNQPKAVRRTLLPDPTVSIADSCLRNLTFHVLYQGMVPLVAYALATAALQALIAPTTVKQIKGLIEYSKDL